MKVESSSPDSYIGSVAGGPQKAAQAPTGAETASAAAKPQPGVTVTLSSTVQAAGSGGGSDVFNAEKVEAMKQAIASGNFQVNAEVIADKMLANAAEMLNAGRA